MGYGVGIDIGTSEVAVAIHRDGEISGFELVDEAVAPQPAPDADPPSEVGALAAKLTAALDRAQERMGTAPDQLALTYPAREGRAGRDRMDEAARAARLDEFLLISDLEAAARGFARREGLAVADPFLVYDLGAGTFSTTVFAVTPSGVVELAPVETAEDAGGAAFDELVLAHIDRSVGGAVTRLDLADAEEARTRQRLDRECDQAKRVLSERDTAVINVLLPDPSDRSASQWQTEVHLTRDAFDAMISPSLESTLAAVHRALDAARTRPDQLAGVLLIGGSSRIPLVAARLADSLGVPVRVDPDPDGCAALGAALICVAPGTAAVPGVDGATALLPGPADVEPSVPEHGPARRRRVLVAAVAATALLIGGATYLVRQQDSPDTGSSLAQATGTPPTSGATTAGAIVVPIDPAGGGSSATGPTGPTGRAGRATTATTGPARPPSTRPTRAAPVTPGAATGRPSDPTAGAPPSPIGSPTRSVAPTATANDPDDVVRIGLLCYDSSRLEDDGKFPIVMCPR